MTSVLITGASGFVGKVLCATLLNAGYQVTAAVRRIIPMQFDDAVLCIEIPTVNAQTDWRKALNGVDVVVHLAARVHVIQETETDALQAFRTVNTEGSKNLAAQAASAGVKRFIFISTIKVLGEHSESGAFNNHSPAAPTDAYAVSKWQGEQAIQALSQKSGMTYVIIRPPLIYGPAVKGNFLRLMQLIRRGIPLPFAGIINQRSMIYVENLCDFIKICIAHPAAANRTLLIADPHAFTSPELIQNLANALGCKARLWFLPVGILKTLGAILGKRDEIDRLINSLRIDAAETYRLLNWQPPFSIPQAMAKTASDFLTKPE